MGGRKRREFEHEEDDGDEAKQSERQHHYRHQDHMMKQAILNEAVLMCTTTIAAGSEMLALIDFQAILIDKVAQATESSVLVLAAPVLETTASCHRRCSHRRPRTAGLPCHFSAALQPTV